MELQRFKPSIQIYHFNNRGTEVDIINYGATVTSFRINNDFGELDDIILGYDNLKDYEDGDKFFGATIGRCANRISKSSFRLNDKVYILKTMKEKIIYMEVIMGFIEEFGIMK